MIYKMSIALLLMLSVCSYVSGQSVPFPQDINYRFGIKPSTVASALAQTEYNRFKNTLLADCEGTFRVIYTDNTAQTRGEAIGFGMLLSGYMGDKDVFDKLFAFYKKKRSPEAKNMMAWNVTCTGYANDNDKGSATDVDIDVAFALVIGYAQWGGDYLNEAKTIINLIKDNLIVPCGNLHVLAPGYSGSAWGGCQTTDIQYYTPAFFRVFAKVTGDNIWEELADDTYTILNAGANPTTGLVPDWQSVSGGVPGDSWRVYYFAYDACRVPWRIALDYLWNGNDNAKQWCTKVSNWAYNIGPANIKDGYNLDGSANNGNNRNSAFIGGFAVASMCNDQAKANSFGTEMTKLADTYWFNLCTRCLYLFTMTGNFWQPSAYATNAEIVRSINDKMLTVYPNPSGNGSFTLEFHKTLAAQSIEVKLVNESGQVLYSKMITPAQRLTVESGLSKGAYLLVIEGKGMNYKGKVVIE